MTNQLKGKSAIITGAGSGIGKGIAQAFVDAEASVILVDINQKKLVDTKKDLEAINSKVSVYTFTADLSKSSSYKEVVEESVHKLGTVDILVNCAGIYPSTPALDITEDEWDQLFDLNLKGYFFLCQNVAKQMVKQDTGGSIINITSTASEVARPGVAHYCASKSGVKMMTQVLALEWAEYGIRINALGPGLVETDTLLNTLSTEKAKQEHVEKLSYCPMGRTALTEEIASGVLFFASDSSMYATGQTLFIDGGYSAGRFFKNKNK
ncbi:SDR family NAD(P)-dependent oxidoreductase [Virgibacillus byunsanensis]|uniref:SDR family NAD(P)-dependent oxidoreductase n=1 Tax=Virgibacillus byunsanensis TaxID=570945 RepID=A0ABW3LGB1_9BACI